MNFITALDRYIFRLVLVPMLGVFVIAASLLMMDKMLRLFEFVSTEGGPIGVVFKMLLNLIPEYASLAIPLGLMLGILLAFRKLATSSELDVMRAVGWSYTRLLRVPYCITAVMMIGNFLIVGYVQPYARYSYEELQYELSSGALGAAIKVGEFTTLEDRMALRIEQSEDDGRRLIGIFARIANDKGQVLSISAREGRFLANREDRNTIILRLMDGTIIQDMKGKTPRILSFTQHDLPIDLPAIERFRKRGGQDREYILPELLEIGWSDHTSDALRAETQANFNYRMVEVVMMLMLPLLAVALAIPPKRSSSALGVFVSIVMVVAYHKVNQYGQSIAALERLDPLLALWGPFAIFAALILWMYYRVAYVPGGQAIGALEVAFAKLASWVKKLWRRKNPLSAAKQKDVTHA
ncbi:LPS export ABC transporter permease LptF [Altericroceibacterium endophyticum]|uniref:LPS export ABC transporter permease LptF n=1 Tax=Altericroceibacterium endophyticum TaxID=1808508 RepID=A0A6I4T293_9SPHN|nr:LPS export ABC transporter permease LptF [Altericroceibacterium endophyticum]MXO65037.1 LPS export ABC transporter permease LptF [Altericroceibacterium endophyticum]